VVAVVLAGAAWGCNTDGARGPYVQRVSDTVATVVWRTEEPADGVLRWGTDPDALDAVATSASVADQHEVTLQGLEPGKRYYYAAGSSTEVLAEGEEYSFVTAPARGDRRKLRAWVLGDSGTGGKEQAEVRDAMLGYVGPTLPDLLLHMGDIAYGTGTDGELSTNFFGMYDPLLRGMPAWPTMGNHEGESADAITQSGPYYDAFVLPRDGEAGGVPSGTEAYYSFDWGNVHFVVLESYQSDRSPGGSMLTWLVDDLAEARAEWLVAYWHHPPYTKGTHDSDTETELIEMRQNVLPILEAAGVDLVLGGHSHLYERSWMLAGGAVVDGGDGSVLGSGPYRKPVEPATGAVYVVAGHGGRAVGQDDVHPLMIRSEAEHGSCLLDVQGNRLAVTNVRADGVVSDTFTIVKGDAIVVGSPDGGEVLQPGAAVPIRWFASRPGDVRIDASFDGGTTWEPVAEAAPGTGSFDWTVPEVAAEAALVRVRSLESEALSDESNGTFAIGGEGRALAVHAAGGSACAYRAGSGRLATLTALWIVGAAFALRRAAQRRARA
jgi:hypothetical protein